MNPEIKMSSLKDKILNKDKEEVKKEKVVLSSKKIKQEKKYEKKTK